MVIISKFQRQKTMVILVKKALYDQFENRVFKLLQLELYQIYHKDLDISGGAGG